MSCGVGHRGGSDPVLLLLWYRPAGTGLIWPLAWEAPYARSTAQNQKNKTKQKKPHKILLYITGNYIQFPGIDCDGKEY